MIYIMRTIGNITVDNNNKRIRFKGVSKTGLEYLGLELNSIIPESIDIDILQMNKWKLNTIRIAMRDIHWLYNQQYKNVIDLVIKKFTENNYYIIIDLHLQGENIKQDNFLLREHSKDFWMEVSKYYNYPNIMFEIFNEPHNISPDVWWNGNDQYYGYKEILVEIRKHSNNICILGGLDYSYQWGFLKYHSNILNELLTFSNIILSSHPYGYRGAPVGNGEGTNQIPYIVKYPTENFSGDCTTGYTLPVVNKESYGWEESFGFLKNDFPMIATEFGLDQEATAIQGGWYVQDLLEYFKKKEIDFIGWAWVPDRLSYPSLITSNFEPTGYANLEPHGPACSVADNNFYKGPGQLVFNYHIDTKKTFLMFFFYFFKKLWRKLKHRP